MPSWSDKSYNEHCVPAERRTRLWILCPELNLSMQGVKEMDKWYLSLLLQSFQIDPINNRRAAWSSLVLPLCTPAPETACETRHNYSRKWNYHNIYSRLKQNIFEHFSSEKPPPSSTYNHKTAFMLENNQGEELVLSAVFGNDLTRPAVWPRLGSLC